VEVWKEFERQNPTPHQLNTMTSLVSAKSSTFAQELTRNYLWHLASGLQTRKGYGFSEGRYYPDIKLDSTVIAQNPDIQLDFQAIPPYAGRAYMLDFTKMPQGFPVNEALTFYLKNSVDNLQLSLGLLAFYKDSTVAEIIPLRTSAQELLVKPKLDYSRLEKIGMVLVNSGSTTTGGTISLKRQIQVGLNPDESLLPTTSQVLPSYPNPFNPRTSIPYTLSQAGYYRLDVIDMQGRIVQILEEGHRKPGTYEHVFEAQGLATGIYLVRLRAGQHLSTQKITLIK
jgi:hypothetical protein